MAVKASESKNNDIALTVALILLVAIAFFPTSGFSQSKNRINSETIIQGLKQPAPPASVIGIKETNSLNATNSFNNYSFALLNSDLVSLDTLNSTTCSHLDMSGFFFSPSTDTGQSQITGSDLTFPINKTNDNISAPTSLDSSQFVTYTYGGYSVQQPNPTEFSFCFPDNVSQGQIAGSDALTLNAYAIQKIDFDAGFIAPKISALGFDEMVIFAASNTETYKGTEFGVRMDLKDGFIYGYVQEPNDDFGEVNFKMQELLPNDEIIHHYTLIMLGSGVLFLVDGLDYCNLSFPSNIDYSSLSFSILAVVHRFTDDWDSYGDNMIAGNFSLNLQ